MNPKIILTICLTLSFSIASFGQDINNFERTNFKKAELTSDALTGYWEFVELQDPQGNKLEKVYHPEWENLPFIENPYETVNRANTTFNSDGTYTKKFTEVNEDTGMWELDTRKGIITFQLLIDPNDQVGQDLIQQNLAIQQTDGNYYEELTEQVYHLSENLLVIKEETGNLRISVKRKK